MSSSLPLTSSISGTNANGHGHSRNASTYISAEAGRPSSTNISNPSGLTQRSPSPSPTRPTFGFNNDVPIPHSNGPIALDKSLSGSGSGSGIQPGGGWSSLTPQRVGKAIGARFMRAVRRGNLPFLLVFFSCTIVFFSALAGVGYHEPLPDSLSGVGSPTPTEAIANPGEFRVGGPVFDDRKGLERRIAEQRALEESWARKRRPKDGAWMRKQRDDKAIRRKPNQGQGTATSGNNGDSKETVGVVVEGGQGLAKRDIISTTAI
ncbi:uncharacterized protein L199_001322 [Kwoniella botswanensis]|uniref:uncharacterized protein n=1 Tax=Kwoniella botswanensis TaxID=1268659 RepID=UPI00315C5A30